MIFFLDYFIFPNLINDIYDIFVKKFIANCSGVPDNDDWFANSRSESDDDDSKVSTTTTTSNTVSVSSESLNHVISSFNSYLAAAKSNHNEFTKASPAWFMGRVTLKQGECNNLSNIIT